MAAKIVIALLAGASCGLLLNIFYVTLKHVWPENYFGLSGSVDPIVSRNLPRWAIFRLVPPAIAAAAAALTAERAHSFVWVAAGVAIAVHVSRLVRATATSAKRRYRAAAVQEGTLALTVTLIMVVATLCRAFFGPVIPEPRDLVSNIWAGFLAAIGAVYLQRVVLIRREPGDLVSRTFDEIPMTLKVHVWKTARATGVDPTIPLAVMAAENLQRPHWARRLERVLPRSLDGTRGIMQQVGARDDVHSIDLAFERNFPPGTAEHSTWEVFTRYNDIPEFRDLAGAAHQMITGDPTILQAIEVAAIETDPG